MVERWLTGVLLVLIKLATLTAHYLCERWPIDVETINFIQSLQPPYRAIIYSSHHITVPHWGILVLSLSRSCLTDLCSRRACNMYVSCGVQVLYRVSKLIPSTRSPWRIPSRVGTIEPTGPYLALTAPHADHVVLPGIFSFKQAF